MFQQSKRQYPQTTFKPHERKSDSRVNEGRQDGGFSDFGQGVSSPLGSSHRKTPSLLAPLKIDCRDNAPLEILKINKDTHTPTQKTINFCSSYQHSINTSPLADDNKFFKAPTISLRKIHSDIKNDYSRDGLGKLLSQYFPPTSDQSHNPSTSSSDTFHLNPVDKQKSATAQSTQNGRRPSQYFSNQYINQAPKEIKILSPKEGSLSEEFKLKNLRNGSPAKTTINTCSTIETLCYRRSEESFQRPSEIFKSNKQSKQLTNNRLKIGDFILIKQLGTGKFGSVYLVRHRITGLTAAIKVIKKKAIVEGNLLKQLIRQLKIQAYLNHPNIISLYGCFDDKENVYILLQLAPEGQLYSKLKKKERYTEETASFIIKSLLSSIQYMHSKKLLHRDIKPENIVVVHVYFCLIKGIVKLCDFGWAVYRGNDLRSTFCGTPLYLSPQLLLGHSYDEKADIWSVGILSYELVTGRMPFEITEEHQLSKIITDEVQFPTDLDLSEEFKDFVLRILNRDPKGRLCSQQLLKHAFIDKYSEFETCQELCVD